MKHILPTDLVNKLLTYLAGKAYQEVFQLINDIKTQAVLHVEPPVPVVPAVPVDEPGCEVCEQPAVEG